MAKHIQCPVCTLFLHAGMNLCDHLETHPKEQVIKALVQMTISGNENRLSVNIKNGDETRKNNTDKASSELRQSPMKDYDVSSNFSSSTNISSLSMHSINSTTASINNNLSFGESSMTDSSSVLISTSLKSTIKGSFDTEQKLIITESPSVTCDGFIKNNSNSCQINNSRQHTQPSSDELRDLNCVSEQLFMSSQLMSLPNFPTYDDNKRSNVQEQSHISSSPVGQVKSCSASFHNPTQTSEINDFDEVCPTLLPIVSTHLNSVVNSHQHPQVYPNHVHQQHSQTQPRQHSDQQPQRSVSVPLHQQQSQHLQFFTYQSNLSSHHQKPPPAYGTAISQIRSQEKQNKHSLILTATTSVSTSSSHQKSINSQSHEKTSQQSKENSQTVNRYQTTQRSPSSEHNEQQKHQQQRLHSDIHASASQVKRPIGIHKTEVETSSFSSLSSIPNSVPNQVKSDLSHHQEKSKGSLHSQSATRQHLINLGTVQPYGKNSQPSLTIATPTSTTMFTTSSGSMCTTTMSVSASLACQSNSPFSTTSVLRYAESPVAHYLERDNGDFIVQETPKHIMEYVEKDNGEFSVIEHIYQSPPSVLHIHDEEEDTDVDINSDDSSVAAHVENSKGNSMKKHTFNKNNDLESEHKNGCRIINKSVKVSVKDKFNSMGMKKSQSDQEDIGNSGGCEEYLTNGDLKSPKEFNPISSKNSKTLKEISTDKSNLVSTTTSMTKTNLSMCGNINVNCHLSQSTARKKSSKNTITVLSDVHLNLNEYLDLVGNIIASSKISTQRKAISSVRSLPLVKVEKEEPLDYDEVQMNSSANSVRTNEDETALQEKSIDNKKIINFGINHIDDEKKPDIYLYTDIHNKDKENSSKFIYTTNCSGHATSVIRMASTTFSTDQQVNCKIEEPIKANENLIKMCKNLSEAEDLTKPQQKIESCDNNKKSFFAALGRKAPKKLIIKPKSMKTDSPMENLNSQNIFNTDDQKPSTSVKAQEENIKLKQRKSSIHVIGANAQSLSQHKQKIHITEDNILKSLKMKDLHLNENLEENECKIVMRVEKELLDIPMNTLSANDSTSSPMVKNSASVHLFSEDLVKTNDVRIKSEPTSNNHESMSKSNSNILNDSLPCTMECEEEKPCLTETTIAGIVQLKTENNVKEDARVLYDFANSKKSIRRGIIENQYLPRNGILHKKCILDTQPAHVDVENGITSHAITLASDNVIIDNAISSLTTSNSHSTSQDTTAFNSTTVSQNSSVSFTSNSQTFIDYPFSFLYTNSNSGSQNTDIKCSQMFYPNIATNISTSLVTSPSATTSSVNSNTTLLKDISSQHETPRASTSGEWFNSTDMTTTSTSNAIASNIGMDYNIPVTLNNSGTIIHNSYSSNVSYIGDNPDVNKYLDLDACKHELKYDITTNNISGYSVNSIQPPPSSPNSCSFNGGTDNSLAGVYSNSTSSLNIRTDEKMPAKGEISEQESNCDIENSWSQHMYGDISTRFFKPSFPGIFTNDSGWNQDDYFAAQDLSATSTAQSSSINANRNKTFDFRLYPDLNTGSNMIMNNNPQMNHNDISNLTIYSPNSNANSATDMLPSTSTKVRKKRKRNIQNDNTANTILNQVQNHQLLELSTQQENYQLARENNCTNFNHHYHHFQHNTTTILSNHLMPDTLNDSVSNSVSHTVSQKSREKTYECARCFVKYSKLKDRNAHMIEVHKYIRQNRKLICPQSVITSTVTSNGNIQSSEGLPSTSSVASSLQTIEPNLDQYSHLQTFMNGDHFVDCKRDIVKIESEHISLTLDPIKTDFVPKTQKEIDDDKGNASQVSIGLTSHSSLLETATNLTCIPQNSTLDVKYGGCVPRLPLNTTSTKLTTLYRMLIAYNTSHLKMKEDFTEIDKKITESLIFSCHICSKSFSSVKFYDIHLTEHPAECFACGKKFQRWKNMSLHLKRHMGWKEFGCNVCEKKFVVRSALVEHMRMHSGQSPLKCKICGKHFKRYSNLTQHRKRHIKQIVRKKEYVCYCGEVLPSKARFIWHKETHDLKPKCCPHCCDRFIHVNSLKRHIRLAHSDKFDYVEPMECAICKQVFAKASMKSHMATHSTENQFDCTICSKSFSTKWNLKIHSWVHANRTAKPFKCEHCPKAFVREIDFKNHINSHKQIRPYTCEVCGCKFIRKYNYMRHRREHHGDKKFSCDLCKKSFHRHYYLIEHRRIHTGERPFQCTICGKSSTTKTNHNKHMKIHHSRDPFTVEV